MARLVLLGLLAMSTSAKPPLNSPRPDNPPAPDLHTLSVDRFSKLESFHTTKAAEPSTQGPDMPQALDFDSGYQDRAFIPPVEGRRNKEKASPAAKLAAQSRSLEAMEKQFREMQHSFMLQNGCKKDCHLVPDDIAAELRERARNMMQADKSTCPYHGRKVRISRKISPRTLFLFSPLRPPLSSEPPLRRFSLFRALTRLCMILSLWHCLWPRVFVVQTAGTIFHG